MYHFCYKTTNTINGKFYLGKHSTENIEDGYLGSGIALLAAVQKYGKENFKREILCSFETSDEAFEFEEILICERMIADENCYNMTSGGIGSSPGEKHFMFGRRGSENPRYGQRHSEESKAKMRMANSGEGNPRFGVTGENHPMFGKRHTEESKAKMSTAVKAHARKLCQHCGTLMDPRNFARYHGDKCKNFRL